ncbi:hypothetical protein H0H93_001255, partial [Arthromyces matolae]
IYSFGGAVDGTDITLGVGRPHPLGNPARLPNTLRSQQPDILQKIATHISRRFKTIIEPIKGDRNAICRATRFVRGGKYARASCERPLVVPQLPDPGSTDYREELLKMIAQSDLLLRRTVDTRNSDLRVLSQVPLSGNIQDPKNPNMYVTYWKNNQIDVYVFGKTPDGSDLTLGVGLPKAMMGVGTFPPLLKKFDTEALSSIATDMLATDHSGGSKCYTLIKEVLNDKLRIHDAMKSLKRNEPTASSIPEPFEVPVLPVRGTSADDVYREALIQAIRHCHERLRLAVKDRNKLLKKLDQLQLSPAKVRNVDNVNFKDVYIAHWMQSHTQDPALPLSETNPTQLSTNKRSGNPAVYQTTTESKRLKGAGQPAEPVRQAHDHGIHIDVDPSLAGIFRERDHAVHPHGPAPSNCTPAAGSAPDHHGSGFQTTHHWQGTASSIPAGPSHPNAPVSEGISSFNDLNVSFSHRDQPVQDDEGTYFDFDRYCSPGGNGRPTVG